MKIFIKAKPNAKKEQVEKISENSFVVAVKEPPVQGRANSAIIAALAEYFKVPKSGVKIVFGFNSRQKVVEVNL
jgi:hypothetical protein